MPYFALERQLRVVEQNKNMRKGRGDEMKRRDFVFRPSGHLATYFTQLKNHVKEAALYTYRKFEVEKTHLR